MLSRGWFGFVRGLVTHLWYLGGGEKLSYQIIDFNSTKNSQFIISGFFNFFGKHCMIILFKAVDPVYSSYTPDITPLILAAHKVIISNLKIN